MKTYTVHTHERTTRIVRVRAQDPREAIELAHETPDEDTHTAPDGADVYDETGADVTPDEDEACCAECERSNGPAYTGPCPH